MTSDGWRLMDVSVTGWRKTHREDAEHERDQMSATLPRIKEALARRAKRMERRGVVRVRRANTIPTENTNRGRCRIAVHIGAGKFNVFEGWTVGTNLTKAEAEELARCL
jgi:hypothetical protein